MFIDIFGIVTILESTNKKDKEPHPKKIEEIKTSLDRVNLLFQQLKERSSLESKKFY